MDGFEYGQSFKWLLWFLLLEYGFMATLLEPGFLDFDNLPDTNFTCVGKVIGGYYADLETACQMFHVCTIGQLDEPMDIRFLCLNGTVFDQETRVCERIDEVDCAKSEQFYSLNLELYGNTQAPILPESEEEEEPSNNGHSTTSPSRTSSTPSEPKVTRQSFIITTAKPTKTTELYKPHTTQRASTTSRYQIPLNRPPDIRFNPKEINVSLNVRGTAHSEHYHPHHHYQGTSSTERLIEHFKISDTSQRPPPKIVRNNQPLVKPTVRTTTTTENVNLYHQTETEHFVDYQKVPPLLRNNYQYRLNVPNFRPSATGLLRHQHQNKYSHTNRPSVFYSPPRNQQHQQYKNQQQRQSVLQPSQSYYNNYRNHQQDYAPTEPPPAKIQLEVPTRQPLTFSSPSPFRLSSQTKDHRQYAHQSPRIVISASASVSDASGRKFNYSLGTIGDSQLFGHAPQSYDDYREEDVGFDPFYHDVLKLNRGGRRKRAAQESSTDAIDTLRFLFEWYNRHKTGDDELINAMWNRSSANLSEPRKDAGEQYNDVIYKSVLDTIKQEDPANAMSNNYEDFDYSGVNVEQSNNYDEDDKSHQDSTIHNEEAQTISDETVTTQNYFEVTEIFKDDVYVPQNYELKFESKPFSKISADNGNDSRVSTPSSAEDTLTTFEEEISEVSTTTENVLETTDPIIQVTERYLQVLNILGITANKNELITEQTTRSTEEVLDSPTESMVFETTTSQRQTDKEETVTEKAFVGSTIFGAKLIPTTMVYTKTTLEDSLEVTTMDEEATTASSETIPTVTEISTTTTALPKPVENSLFRTSNHRFNRFRNKPQRYSSGKSITSFAQETTTRRSSYFTPHPTIVQLPNPKLVSQTYSLQTNNNATAKSLVETPMKEMLKNYIFNCFGKELNQFYSDPRDCRLFHYCTHGFTSTQLLDMKFVCDLGTFFDNEKLVCTKNKPSRCI